MFATATFLASFLLFVVEPLVAKMLLPRLGGSPAVWNTAAMFFQLVLLAGYWFAHIVPRVVPRALQVGAQVGVTVAAVLVLPVHLPEEWRPDAGTQPVVWTVGALALAVGLPFFALSTITPTIQRWFSTTGHPQANDPYFLYAAGNTGSLLGLIAYPFVLEPLFPLDRQAVGWAVGYLLFVATLVACGGLHRMTARAVGNGGAVERSEGAPAPPLTAQRRLRWVALSAAPSAAMLGLTHHASTDIAAIPLLWVVPLALYLVSFIVAFGSSPARTVRGASRVAKLLAVPVVLSFLGIVSSLWFDLVVHLGAFVALAIVAHGQLAADRPPAEQLTDFYLWLSVGGATGGILAALIAPVLFTTVLEYPIAIVGGLLVLPASAFPAPRHGPGDGRRRAAPLIGGALAAAIIVGATVARSRGSQEGLTAAVALCGVALGGAYVLARRAVGFAAVAAAVLLSVVLVPSRPTLDQRRTFFGVHRVYAEPENDDRHVLVNGQTVHGIENRAGPHAFEPETYYHRTGPAGQLLTALRAEARPLHVGVVGLGTGALSWYGRAGDTYDYFEIDPVVVDIARDPGLFTFVSRSAADVRFFVGDGRLLLEDRGTDRFDLLVLDAFSSDAIPLHLLSKEAVDLYRHRLAGGGVIAFHISNRFFDFEPVLDRLARELGLAARIQADGATEAEAAEGKFAATWVVLAADDSRLDRLAAAPRWRPLTGGDAVSVWTDQYANLLSVFRRD